MPIPLTTIPNAPALPSPTMREAGPRRPAVQALDLSGAQLDGSGISATQSLLAGAGSDRRQGARFKASFLEGTQKDLVPNIAGIAAEGMGAVAQGISLAGQSLSHFAAQMQEAQDLDAVSQASIAMDTAFAQHKDDIANGKLESEQQWVPSWLNDKVPAIQEQLETLKASPRAKAAIRRNFAQFNSKATVDFGSAATDRHLEVIGGNALNASELAFKNGDYEGASTLLEQAVKVGVIRQDQADQKLTQWVDQRRDQQAIFVTQSNPQAVLDDAKEYKASGESKLFPWAQPAQINKYESEARQQVSLIRADSADAGNAAISTGEWTTPDQIKDFGENNYWTQDMIDSATKALEFKESNSPEAQTKYFQHQAELMRNVRSYDPTGDKNLNGYLELSNQIRTELPPGMRDTLLDELSKVRRDGTAPNSDLEKQMLSYVGQLHDQGYLNTEGFDKDGKIKNVDQAKQSMLNQVNVQNQIRQILTDNPKITTTEAFQKLDETLGSKVIGSAAQKALEQSKSGGWFGSMIEGLIFSNDRRHGTKFAPPTNSQIDEKLKGTDMSGFMRNSGTKIGTPSSQATPDFRGQNNAASIRFNNPGAMYPGPSAKKFGSTQTETIGGGHKIAVFPDAVSGAAAQFDLLASKYTGKTLGEAIKTWSGGNDVPTYLRVIEKETGLTADSELTPELIKDPKTAIAIAKAMALQEAGKAYPLTDEQWKAAHKKAFA